jgi:hypothetical protein
MIEQKLFRQKINIVTGHYGSGKTNLVVNLALRLRESCKSVGVVDLDIVNPYFRTADFESLFSARGIELIAPVYANTNLDLPALSGAVDAAFNRDFDYLLLDVGGDDAGAIALGRYAPMIAAQGYDMLYVINHCRYLTVSPEEAAELLREIEQASRLQASALINNSNLGAETTSKTVLESLPFAEEVSRLTGLPLWGNAVKAELLSGIPNPIPVEIFVRPAWER